MKDAVAQGTDELFTAIYEGEDDSVVRLLRAGVSAHAVDEEEETTLHLAAVQDLPGIVRLLLAAGADPNRGSGPDQGELPLCAAAVWGHTEAVRALLAAGARPDAREEFGGTALLWAAGNGHADTVDALLKQGADITLADARQECPLVLAARRGSPATVRVLLEHGTDETQRRAALDESRKWLDVDIAEELETGLLRTHGDGHESRTRRLAQQDGTGIVMVELLRDGEPFAGHERETGHRAIVALLEGELGQRAE
ncbi:ankyrin repeat domain-containing protein [Streptomyces albipurpureus]|uniref:Ankyrin repeat domain-containing protein n=1 Tax=Streptomyces albipurpureus TaxID=2897419 RepID=A0ABT0UQA6_9ACTN|nr:ankyrin repeat domain-containing protein [Streptomyces sp. CWNU-1]MCM2390784.1 ankyrin repeat domain-containing protein [Streptomyces sp. CWNU-1]